jgi:hypothetical protein
MMNTLCVYSGCDPGFPCLTSSGGALARYASPSLRMYILASLGLVWERSDPIKAEIDRCPFTFIERLTDKFATVVTP